jgi:hypothetical protein
VRFAEGGSAIRLRIRLIGSPLQLFVGAIAFALAIFSGGIAIAAGSAQEALSSSAAPSPAQSVRLWMIRSILRANIRPCQLRSHDTRAPCLWASALQPRRINPGDIRLQLAGAAGSWREAPGTTARADSGPKM